MVEGVVEHVLRSTTIYCRVSLKFATSLMLTINYKVLAKLFILKISFSTPILMPMLYFPETYSRYFQDQ